ncbi:DUF2778 domain-containing protein [Burkholderia gladioli]|nr:DUF2778 domain-containing protein [Burkholderia gladioli]
MPNPYAAEIGRPIAPACARSTIALSFDGRRLTMIGSPTRIYTAVSGQPTTSGTFDYSEMRQQIRGEGPIPAGTYWIQPSQMWTNRWYNIAPRSVWGDHRITIHIMPGTMTFNRGGFFIHGGSHTGSAGCINLHSGMEKFVKDLEAVVKNSPDCYISLTVKYR